MYKNFAVNVNALPARPSDQIYPAIPVRTFVHFVSCASTEKDMTKNFLIKVESIAVSEMYFRGQPRSRNFFRDFPGVLCHSHRDANKQYTGTQRHNGGLGGSTSYFELLLNSSASLPVGDGFRKLKVLNWNWTFQRPHCDSAPTKLRFITRITVIG